LRSLVGERGSVLVTGLMLVFVMTILGLALFNVARLDARLKLDSQTNVQALEIAEAGLERGLHLFYLEFLCGPTVTSPITAANCANPPPTPNWITDNKLARISLATACPAALLTDGATGFKQLVLNQAFAGGTYTVCVRRDPDAPTNQLRAQFRSRGVMAAVTGTASHIVQINATANVTANKPHAPFAIGGPTGGAFRGGARIAGSLQFVKCPGSGCVAANFSGNSGILNNYNGLNATLHDRIPWKYADGTTVNTLGAVLKVKEGTIQISANSACLGGPESGGGSCGNTPAQDTLTGVYSSGNWSGSQGACNPPPPSSNKGLNGSTTTNSRCNVWTSAQGPYPSGELSAIPLLSDSTIIDGVGYRCFFNPPGSTCPNSTDPVPGGTNFPEYFYTSAWRIDASRGDAGCDINVTGTAADCTAVLTALQTGATPDFGAGPVLAMPIKNAACTRQGATTATSCTLQIAAGHIVGFIDGAPIRPDLEPINVYLKRLGTAPVTTPTLKTSPVDAVTDNNMYYQGKVIIVADNPTGTPAFEIDTGLLSDTTVNQTWAGCGSGAYPCGYPYPANHFLGMLTTGDIKLGPGGARNILGTFFAANTALTAQFYVTGATGTIQLAGTVSAQQFDFSAAGTVPQLYQAPWNLSLAPGAAGPAAGAFLSIVSSKWDHI
jgi:type IV pilus assembly PilX-like protein